MTHSMRSRYVERLNCYQHRRRYVEVTGFDDNMAAVKVDL